MRDSRKFILPIVLVVVIIMVAMWYMTYERDSANANGPLSGSGTVETVRVIISSEMAGRVTEVLASEGDSVQAGEMLFRLDDTLLLAQRAQAQAGLDAARSGVEVALAGLAAAQASLDTAQAQYDLEVALARQQAQPTRLTAWDENAPAEFELPVWYFTDDEDLEAARAEVEAAAEALADERANFDAVMAEAGNAEIRDAETRLAQAQTTFLIAGDVLKRAEAQDNPLLTDYARRSYDSALADLEAAQQEYNRLLSSAEAADVLDARARMAVAQERYETALDRYNALLTGEDSLRVRLAEVTLAQAKAALSQAEARVNQAETAVSQAQAQLDLIDVQIGKLTVYAPVSGVVLARNIEPGEIIQPGAVALTLGQLDRLTITVYIPEDRYGEIKLGEHAMVSVDSFPGVIFDATVTRIADQAEFTPRNVQTEEGRRATVFAIELSVTDPQGRLKPGMPADVTFGE